MRPLELGATGTLTHLVRVEDGAARWGNDLPVLATPVLLWLGEIAAMRAVADALQGDEMTVGRSHDAEHVAATPVGWTVEVTAVLTRVEGRTLHFAVRAQDAHDVVFTGEHVRSVVSRERFTGRLVRKSASPVGPGTAHPLGAAAGRP